ncbi:MAG: vanadium-dependent haloperoxidase [Acidimicrobiaceae bacterium]|nr:vanadium-dependent haloperoxidase [Acidimicrobiaceae bacterium]
MSASKVIGSARRASTTISILVIALIVAGCSSSTKDGTRSSDCTLGPSDVSAARIWSEALIDEIRFNLDEPPVNMHHPTVDARNLYHLSVAMWDAFAAFDETAKGVHTPDVDIESVDRVAIQSAQRDAVMAAGYTVATARYATSQAGAAERLDRIYEQYCGAVRDSSSVGTSVGLKAAATVLFEAESDGISDVIAYRAVNNTLRLENKQISLNDPNRWQPIFVPGSITSRGIRQPAGVQLFEFPHWGWLEGFALSGRHSGVALDPGPPPLLGDPETDAQFKAGVLEVIRRSNQLEVGVSSVDVSPAVMGNADLDSYAHRGHDANPTTGEPYMAAIVDLGNVSRVIAEYWGDGPNSETPPGHWFVLANDVSDMLPEEMRRIGGSGPSVSRLQWDTSLYLMLGGALHDAGIAAWGTKRHYDYIRPISAIRYMGSLGQSSDESSSSYSPDGLPLEPGLVEVITAESTVPEARHEHLEAYVGEIAVRGWLGVPLDSRTEVVFEDQDEEFFGVGWIRAADWLPFQQPNFISPAFPGYVSGHSTFSRAAADVLTAFTGSPYFPHGLGTHRAAIGSLQTEFGPSDAVVLQWATYADAADQAGLSRLYSGVHFPADDLRGRELGAAVAERAVEKAFVHFG